MTIEKFSTKGWFCRIERVGTFLKYLTLWPIIDVLKICMSCNLAVNKEM
jgi:hypothetical protein